MVDGVSRPHHAHARLQRLDRRGHGRNAGDGIVRCKLPGEVQQNVAAKGKADQEEAALCRCAIETDENVPNVLGTTRVIIPIGNMPRAACTAQVQPQHPPATSKVEQRRLLHVNAVLATREPVNQQNQRILIGGTHGLVERACKSISAAIGHGERHGGRLTRQGRHLGPANVTQGLEIAAPPWGTILKRGALLFELSR